MERSDEIIERYRRPTLAPEVIEEVRDAVSSVPGVIEAYLVERQVTVDGHTGHYRPGIAARLRTRRFRSISAELAAALRPFRPRQREGRRHASQRSRPDRPDDPPPTDETHVIFWSSSANSPVGDEVRSLGVSVGPVSVRRRRLWRLG